jgi:hypothetical protein
MAIIHAVVYASIFDYPLTLEQLRVTLVGVVMSREQILATYDASHRLQAIIEYRDGFFTLNGRANLIRERCRREARSRAFLIRHERLLRWICTIPFTRMVALSGSVAHLNMEADADLDLFIVTSGHRVWSVTIAVLLLTKLLRARRVVCVNFAMSDASLTVEQHDLFTASQVLHLKPLIGPEVFDGFLAANPFVRRFFPNYRPVGSRPPFKEFERFVGRRRARFKRLLECALAEITPPVEWLCRHAYTWHLRRRSITWTSPDQVRLRGSYLKLHTKSHRRSVLERFDQEVELAVLRSDRVRIGEHAAIA